MGSLATMQSPAQSFLPPHSHSTSRPAHCRHAGGRAGHTLSGAHSCLAPGPAVLGACSEHSPMHDPSKKEIRRTPARQLRCRLATHLGPAGTLEDHALSGAHRGLNGIAVVTSAGSCQAVLLATILPARAAPQHLGAVALHAPQVAGRGGISAMGSLLLAAHFASRSAPPH